MKKLIKKEKRHAFRKDIYLFGINSEGKKIWLEAPSWDCEWYWGFGYMETYTNNDNPEKAKDIMSHSHFSGLVGGQEKYDFETRKTIKLEYIHNVYDNPDFSGFTFDKETGWKISELFKQFYLLKDMAEFCHKKPFPGCNITTVREVNHGDLTAWYDHINKVMIPAITTEILNLLTPEL